jgi:hypothetical protein
MVILRHHPNAKKLGQYDASDSLWKRKEQGRYDECDSKVWFSRERKLLARELIVCFMILLAFLGLWQTLYCGKLSNAKLYTKQWKTEAYYQGLSKRTKQVLTGESKMKQGCLPTVFLVLPLPESIAIAIANYPYFFFLQIQRIWRPIIVLYL